MMPHIELRGVILKKLCLIFILSFLSTTAAAGEKQEIAKCAAKKSDAERLICYDALARSLGVDKPKTMNLKGKGAWNIRTERSPIDDSMNVYLSVQSQELVRSGYYTVRPSLQVRCKENKTEIYINWDLYLGLDSTMQLTRFDDLKASEDFWSISTSSKAVFAPGSHIDFLKKTMKHNKLLVQITPYGESPVMATFDIRGLAEAIKPLREACHW